MKTLHVTRYRRILWWLEEHPDIFKQAIAIWIGLGALAAGVIGWMYGRGWW